MVEWTGARYGDGPEVAVDVWVAAAPQAVWPLVSDVEQMPAMSGELQRVEWVDRSGAAGPAVGDRFVGHNRHRDLGDWSATSRIAVLDPPRTFAWEVESDSPGVAAARWSFDLAAADDGTRLVERVRLGPGRSGLSIAIASMPDKEQKIVFVRLREFEAAMSATLAAIKQRVEGG